MATIYGIPPHYLEARIKPFIKDARYVNEKGGRKRLAKHQKNRQHFTVGYPRMSSLAGKPCFEIWSANGGTTFDEALAFLDMKMAIFKAQVDYLNRTGKLNTTD